MKQKIEVSIEYELDFDKGDCIARAVARNYLYIGHGLTFDAARDHVISKIQRMSETPKSETIIIEVDE